MSGDDPIETEVHLCTCGHDRSSHFLERQDPPWEPVPYRGCCLSFKCDVNRNKPWKDGSVNCRRYKRVPPG